MNISGLKCAVSKLKNVSLCSEFLTEEQEQQQLLHHPSKKNSQSPDHSAHIRMNPHLNTQPFLPHCSLDFLPKLLSRKPVLQALSLASLDLTLINPPRRGRVILCGKSRASIWFRFGSLSLSFDSLKEPYCSLFKVKFEIMSHI